MTDATPLKPKKPRAKIVAPLTPDNEEPFEVIREYWFTTYPALNPFEGSPRCRQCKRAALFERHIGSLHGGAVSVNEFACQNGHVWHHERTND